MLARESGPPKNWAPAASAVTLPHMIHPAAIVSPDAQIGANVKIGPYAVIEGSAVVGDDCEIGAAVIVSTYARLGKGVMVRPCAVVGGDPQDIHFDRSVHSTVNIGDHATLGEHSTVHRSTQPGGETRVGARCFVMAASHVGHDCVLESNVIIAQGAMLGGHVSVGASAFIGGGAAVHQFVKIGRMSIMQGNSVLTQNLPPFSISAEVNELRGLNVIGMRRSGFSAPTRHAVKAAFDLVYRRGLNIGQALEAAAQSTWISEAEEFFEFIRNAGRRGVCRMSRRTRDQASADEDKHA